VPLLAEKLGMDHRDGAGHHGAAYHQALTYAAELDVSTIRD